MRFGAWDQESDKLETSLVGSVKVVLWSKNQFFFSSDFERVFTYHLTGKILSFLFYPKAVYFECKFWILRSAITRVQNWAREHQRAGSRETDVIYSPA